MRCDAIWCTIVVEARMFLIYSYLYLSLACASTISRYITVHKGNLVTQTIQSWDSYNLSQEAHFESHSSGCVTATGDMSETMRCKFCAISVTAWSDISRDNPICHVAFHLCLQLYNIIFVVVVIIITIMIIISPSSPFHYYYYITSITIIITITTTGTVNIIFFISIIPGHYLHDSTDFVTILLLNYMLNYQNMLFYSSFPTFDLVSMAHT